MACRKRSLQVSVAKDGRASRKRRKETNSSCCSRAEKIKDIGECIASRIKLQGQRSVYLPLTNRRLPPLLTLLSKLEYV